MKKESKFTKPEIILVALTIVAFLIRLFPLDTSYFFWDEAVYLLYSQYFTAGWSPLVEFFQRPPLLPFILSINFFSNEVSAKIWVAILNALYVPLVYLIGKEFSKKTGLTAAAIACFFPFHILFSRYIMTDSIAALFAGFTIYLYYYGLKNKHIVATFAAGFFLGISILMKFTNLMFIPIYLVIFLHFRKGNFWRFFLSIGLSLIPMVPYFILNYHVFGNSLYPFIGGFHVVQESEPTSLILGLFSIYDFLGPIIILSLMIGTFIASKMRYGLFLTLWLAYGLIYFFLIIQRGIDKPPGIEWLSERFLFPLLVPAVVLASVAVVKLKARWIVFILILMLLFSLNHLKMVFTPAIELEDGLRKTTKETGLYLAASNASLITCTFNCPPLAYYSQVQTDVVYQPYMNIDSDYLVIISKQEPSIDFPLDKRFANKGWQSYVYSIRD